MATYIETTDGLGKFSETRNGVVLRLSKEGAEYFCTFIDVRMVLIESFPVYYTNTDIVNYSKQIYKAVGQDIYLDVDHQHNRFGVWDRIPDAEEFWAEIAQPISDEFTKAAHHLFLRNHRRTQKRKCA